MILCDFPLFSSWQDFSISSTCSWKLTQCESTHNREEHSGGENQQHRYGYLMKGSNKLTIMAYKRDSYTQKIARFSADTTVNGIRLGDSQNNNVDQIRKAAPILAEIGDESCSDKCGSCGEKLLYLFCLCHDYWSGWDVAISQCPSKSATLWC